MTYQFIIILAFILLLVSGFFRLRMNCKYQEFRHLFDTGYTRWNITTKNQAAKTKIRNPLILSDKHGPNEREVKQWFESDPKRQYLGVSVPLDRTREENFKEILAMVEAMKNPLPHPPDMF